MTQVLLHSPRPCFTASSEQPGGQALLVCSDRLRKLRLGQDKGLAQGHRARRCRRRVGTQFAWLLRHVCERMLVVSRQRLGSVQRVRSGRGRGLTSETQASRLRSLRHAGNHGQSPPSWTGLRLGHPWIHGCNAELCLMIFPGQDSRLHNKTLKRTRKFVVDGVEVSITTSKIISEDEKKDEEMRFLR